MAAKLLCRYAYTIHHILFQPNNISFFFECNIRILVA
jgi:hypothetical protein